MAEELKAPVSDVVRRAQTLTKELKDLRKQLEKSRGGERSAQLSDLLASAPTQGGVKVIVAALEDVSPDELRAALDVIRKSNQEAAAVLASVAGDKVSLIAYAGKEGPEAGSGCRKAHPGGRQGGRRGRRRAAGNGPGRGHGCL